MTNWNSFVKNRPKVWSLDNEAKRYGVLPSELIWVEHPIAAYWFNEAVAWFGQFVENRLNERDPATHKPLYTIDALLGIEAEAVEIKI